MTLDLSAFLATHNPELIHLRRHLATPSSGRPNGRPPPWSPAAWRPSASGHGCCNHRHPGLICDIGDGDGPTVALGPTWTRCPCDEKDVPYRSTVPGVCHACGHDVHHHPARGRPRPGPAGRAAAGPGRPDLPAGRECLPSGSIDVIADRVLEGVSAIYALHCDPKLEVGRLGIQVGAITAASDLVEVHLAGPGGHTTRPHLTADLVYAIGQVVTDLPAALAAWSTPGPPSTSPSRRSRPAPCTTPSRPPRWPGAPCGCWTGRSGARPKLVERILEATVAPYPQVSYRLDYQRGAPPVVNDEEAAAVFATATRTAIGDEAVLNAPQSMGGRTSPGTWRRSPAPWPASASASPGTDLDIHAASFDVDERAIAVGVRILVETATQALERYGAAEAEGGRLRRPAGRGWLREVGHDHRCRFRVRRPGRRLDAGDERLEEESRTSSARTPTTTPSRRNANASSPTRTSTTHFESPHRSRRSGRWMRRSPDPCGGSSGSPTRPSRAPVPWIGGDR